MANSGAIKAGAAYVEIFADRSSLMRGLKLAERSLRAWGTSISSMGKKMAALGSAIITPLVGAAIKASKYADELKDMSDITGASVESLQTLSYAADLNDISMQSLSKSIVFMHKSIYALRQGLKTSVEAFSILGISVNDIQGLSPEKQFMMIAQRLAAIKNPSTRAALALQIFGRAGSELLPLINQGKEAIAAYAQEFEKLGIKMSGQDVEAGAKLHEELKKLWFVVKNGLVVSIGSALGPALRKMANWLTEIIAITTRWIKENRSVVTMVFWLAASLTAAGSAFVLFGSALLATSKLAGIISSSFGIIKTALMQLISPLGLVIVALAAATAAFLYFTGYGGQLMQWLGGCFNSLKEDAIRAFDGISKALAKGDLGLAARIGWLFIKLEWLKAKQWLLEIWYSVKLKVLEYWYSAVYGIVDSFNVAIYGIQFGWIETVALLKTAWAGFKQFYGSTVDWIAKKMLKVWIWWKKLMDPTFNADFAQESIDQEFEADKKERHQQTDKDLEQIEKHRSQRRSEVENQLNAKLLASKQLLDEDMQKQNDEVKAKSKQIADELAKTKREFDASIVKANQPVQHKQMQKLPDKNWQFGAGLDKVSTTGTFSAFGLSQLGAGSVMQKIADATLRTAEATEDMADSASSSGIEFGD